MYQYVGFRFAGVVLAALVSLALRALLALPCVALRRFVCSGRDELQCSNPVPRPE